MYETTLLVLFIIKLTKKSLFYTPKDLEHTTYLEHSYTLNAKGYSTDDVVIVKKKVSLYPVCFSVCFLVYVVQ